jgi:hypothetical protein
MGHAARPGPTELLLSKRLHNHAGSNMKPFLKFQLITQLNYYLVMKVKPGMEEGPGSGILHL